MSIQKKKKALLVIIPLLILVIILVALPPKNPTSKNAVTKLYIRHQAQFEKAAETGDFSSLEKIRGVHDVSESDPRNYEDTWYNISCGGKGFGPSTHYYGIFYSESDVEAKLNENYHPDGNGYRYKQPDGDNETYIEPLGNNYYYYEAHF